MAPAMTSARRGRAATAPDHSPAGIPEPHPHPAEARGRMPGNQTGRHGPPPADWAAAADTVRVTEAGTPWQAAVHILAAAAAHSPAAARIPVAAHPVAAEHIPVAPRPLAARRSPRSGRLATGSQRFAAGRTTMPARPAAHWNNTPGNHRGTPTGSRFSAAATAPAPRPFRRQTGQMLQ